jgi:hypothetical protein
MAVGVVPVTSIHEYWIAILTFVGCRLIDRSHVKVDCCLMESDQTLVGVGNVLRFIGVDDVKAVRCREKGRTQNIVERRVTFIDEGLGITLAVDDFFAVDTTLNQGVKNDIDTMIASMIKPETRNSLMRPAEPMSHGRVKWRATIPPWVLRGCRWWCLIG